MPRRTKKTSQEIARPVKSSPIALTKTMGVADAYAAIVQAALAHLQANEPGVLSGMKLEFLHQTRVALRRLRSALSVFRGLRRSDDLADMRWVSAQLGAARDWDVFVFETLPQAAKAFSGQEATSEIRRRSLRLRRTAWTKARRAVASKRHQMLKLRLHGSRVAAPETAFAHGDEPLAPSDLRSYAVQVLERRYKKVCKRGRALHAQSADELHALRIAVKKLRYPVEFFSSLFDPAPAQELRTRLMALQDLLGSIHDSATTQRLLSTAGGSDTPAIARGVDLLAGWAEGRSCSLQSRLDATWRTFRDARTFW